MTEHQISGATSPVPPNERAGRGSAISLIREFDFLSDGDKGTKYRIWVHPDLILLDASVNCPAATARASFVRH